MFSMKNKSLQSKMIAMNAAIVFVIGLGFFYQVMGFTSKQQDGVHDQFISLAKATNDSIQAQFFERYGDVQAFAMNPLIHPGSTEINSTLENYAALYGIYDLIIVADVSGKIVGVNLKDPSGKELAAKNLLGRSVVNDPWFKNSMAGSFTEDKEKAFVGTYVEDVHVDPYVSEVYGEKRVGTAFSAVIKDGSGKVIGVVTNRAGSRWFEGELKNVASAAISQGLDHPVVSVVNKDGVLIGEAEVAADGKITVQRDLSMLTNFSFLSGAPAQIGELMGKHKAGLAVGMNPRKKMDYIWGFSPETGPKWVDSIGWSVIVSGSKEEAYAPVWAIRKDIFLWLGFFFVGAICAGFFFSRNLAEKLRVMASGLSENSAEVSQVARALAVSSNELSNSSKQQAAALQETVASIDEVSAMVQKNADNAKRSQEVSNVGSEKALGGKNAVGDMIRAIDEINSSNQEIVKQIGEGNRQISEIVKVITEIGSKTKVINDIVFQTKLLSFNASVEAARAGEHGKGFAVVAEEVGNLAQMSGNAAKEISDMLDSSIAKVESIVRDTQTRVDRLTAMSREKIESGTVIAQRCGEVLDEIVQSVNEVNGMVIEIATASREQAVGVNEINRAMNQLDELTQANSTASQSAADSAEELKGQSVATGEIIAELVFSVEGVKGARRVAFSSSDTGTGEGGDSEGGEVISFPQKPDSRVAH